MGVGHLWVLMFPWWMNQRWIIYWTSADMKSGDATVLYAISKIAFITVRIIVQYMIWSMIAVRYVIHFIYHSIVKTMVVKRYLPCTTSCSVRSQRDLLEILAYALKKTLEDTTNCKHDMLTKGALTNMTKAFFCNRFPFVVVRLRKTPFFLLFRIGFKTHLVHLICNLLRTKSWDI